MRGHVYKRGSSWTVVFDEQPDEHGKRRQRSKGGFATKRDAQQFLNKQLTRLDSGTYTAPSKCTVSEFLMDEWLPAVAGTLRPLSLTQYEMAVRRRIVPHIGRVRLQALSAGHLNGMYNALEQEGLAVSTRRLTHAVMHRALRDAVRWGRVPRNVADLADPPRATASRATAWTERELARFLDHVAADRLTGLWRVAATTGMRRGEVLGLTWRALDLDGARLTVEQQVLPTRGGTSFGPPKSNRSRRTVALDTRTVEMLREHRATQLLERDFAASAYGDRDLVFCDQLGGPIDPRRLTEWFAKHRRAAGIPTGSLHVLRHTAATLALTRGVPVHIVAARLGDDPKQILGTYSHLLPQSDEMAAERIAEAIA
jgi:integrase